MLSVTMPEVGSIRKVMCCDCGREVIKTCGIQKRCSDCKIKAQRQAVREWRVRSKTGGAIPIGAVIKCSDCGSEIIKRGGKQIRCVPCGAAAKAKTSDRAAWRIRKGGPVAGIGDAIQCAVCSAPIIRRGAGQRFCGPCANIALATRAKVSSDKARRKRGVPQVKGNKADCRLCGREFELNRNLRAKVCYVCRPVAWKLDPQKKINLAIGNNIRASIKAGSKRRRNWQTLVGFTLEELKGHLQQQFLPGMSFGNHGEWHIDHIRPLCSFSFQTPDDPQFREAWALTNLQPLWARDNLSKGGRYTP